jgi:hypothetical protein
MRRSPVAGQTGKVVLSDGTLKYDKDRRRAVRYKFTKMGPNNWQAWVCGPFHSVLYGVCSFGTTKSRAKDSLQRRLANDYGFIGTMMLSADDEADKVGEVDCRLLDQRANAWPITRLQACGSAGQ